MRAIDELRANREAHVDAVATLEEQQAEQAAALTATQKQLEAAQESGLETVTSFLEALKDEPEVYRAYFSLQWGERPAPVTVDEADICLRLIYKIHDLADTITALDGHLKTTDEPVSVLVAKPSKLQETSTGAQALSLTLATPQPGEGLTVGKTGPVYDVGRQGYVSKITDIRIAAPTTTIATHDTGFDDTTSFLDPSNHTRDELVLVSRNAAIDRAPEQFKVAKLDHTSDTGIGRESIPTYYVGTTGQLLHLVERTQQRVFDSEVIRHMAQHLHALREF